MSVSTNPLPVKTIKQQLSEEFINDTRRDGVELNYNKDDVKRFNRTWNLLNRLNEDRYNNLIRLEVDKDNNLNYKNKSVNKFRDDKDGLVLLRYKDTTLPVVLKQEDFNKNKDLLLPEFSRYLTTTQDDSDFNYYDKVVREDHKNVLTKSELNLIKDTKLSTLKSMLTKNGNNKYNKRYIKYGNDDEGMRKSLASYLTSVNKLQLVNPHDKIRGTERVNLVDNELKFGPNGIVGITKGNDSSLYEKRNGELYTKRNVKSMQLDGRDVYYNGKDNESRSKLVQLLPFIRDKDKVNNNFQSTITKYNKKRDDRNKDDESSDDVL